MVSREKKKEVSRVREKLKARPWLGRTQPVSFGHVRSDTGWDGLGLGWLASVWQKARHWVAIEEETPSHIVTSII